MSEFGKSPKRNMPGKRIQRSPATAPAKKKSSFTEKKKDLKFSGTNRNPANKSNKRDVGEGGGIGNLSDRKAERIVAAHKKNPSKRRHHPKGGGGGLGRESEHLKKKSRFVTWTRPCPLAAKIRRNRRKRNSRKRRGEAKNKGTVFKRGGTSSRRGGIGKP